MRRLIVNVNAASDDYNDAGLPLPQDTRRFSWTRRVRDYAEQGFHIPLDPDEFTIEMYRPFCKEYVYFDKFMNERTLQQPRIFPLAAASGRKDTPATPVSINSQSNQALENAGNEMTLQHSPSPCHENKVIMVGERGVIMADLLPDLELNHHGQCFPLYWYEKREDGESAKDQNSLFGTQSENAES